MNNRRKNAHFFERCIRCEKPSKGAPFCSDACKHAQQTITWGRPLVELPVYKRLPRTIPTDKERA